MLRMTRYYAALGKQTYITALNDIDVQNHVRLGKCL